MNFYRLTAVFMAAFLMLTGGASESFAGTSAHIYEGDFSLSSLRDEVCDLKRIGHFSKRDEDTEVTLEASSLEESETKTYYGSCTITHYCNCSICCGQWAGGNTASGVPPQAGVTVACGDLPFGTEIEINGSRYIVQDRGVPGQWIDVYCSSHEEALQRGMYTADVYIIAYE